MIAAVMCGGKGSRMAQNLSVEKPMILVRGKPLVEYVLDAIVGSRKFSLIFAVASCHTPQTTTYLQRHRYCLGRIVELINTSGIDYSTDLGELIQLLRSSQIFIVPSDVPLLDIETVNEIVKRWNPSSHFASVLLEKDFVTKLGLKPSIVIHFKGMEYCHSGISILDTSQIFVGSDAVESYTIMNRKEIAFNINTKDDLEALSFEIS
jgi:adenosylcobinamide-phosphate guanylyltransferase